MFEKSLDKMGFAPRLLSAVVAAALAGPVIANDTDHVDEHLTVLAKSYRNTATKTALAPEETPQGISVIDSETMELRGVSSVTEALRYVPGVNTELRGGAVTRLDLFNIRGFDNYQNFYDGLQLLFNGWNLQPQIDPFAVEQIEVFKGPTSVLYGNMPPGGMVNMIAKSPQMERHTEIGVASGSHNKAEATFDSTGQIGSSDFAYRVIAKANKQDGMADTSEEERYLIAPSLDWHISDATLLNLNAYYQHDPSAGIYTTMPSFGSVQGNPNGDLSRSLFTGDQNWNEYDRKVGLYGAKLTHDFNTDWSVLVNARYMDAEALQKNTYNLCYDAATGTYCPTLESDGRTLNRRAYLTDETSKGWTVDLQLSGYVTTGALEHNLLFGMDWQKLESEVQYWDAQISAIDIYNPNNNMLDHDSLYDYLKSNPEYWNGHYLIDVEQTGVYFQNQMRLDRLVMIAGLRYDEYSYQEREQIWDGKTKQNQYNTSFRFGGLYEFDNGWAPYISYAESFEPEIGTDTDGNAFDPSTGKQWEGGVKYSSYDRDINFTGSLFHITKENAVTRDPNGSPYDQIQVGETVSKGLELEGSWQVNHNLNLMANYTLLDMTIEKDTDLQGKTPVWVPDQTANLWASYHFYQGSLNGLTLGGGARYVGETQIDSQNTSTVSGYTLFDLSVGYDMGSFTSSLENAVASVAVTNLFDKEYYSCYDQMNCWAGDERRIEARVKLGF
ncbi:TonB-dependent siderophore receptor [Aliagarivorans marinus]|uniref:TonB-dependent siderophore receptor n=1 Tax=Aliagarivorans marinus TaxID=561965 RepID=UPI000410DE35|nr:TonB-dependent siderophore receptor [Aliagarivorans marinus]